jgi:creatinine amidohydrolase
MAARELRLRHGDFVVVPFGVSRLPNASGKQVSEKEKKLSMHAGHSETALMLALAPDTVHMDKAVANYPPEFPIKMLSSDGRPACAWTSRDFGPTGVIGDPTTATREQGEEILDTLANSWVQVLTELYHLEWVVREEATWERGQYTGHIQSTWR